MAEPGLRERKKWETRRRISDVATGLFLARGFDNVTVAEIAEAAGVAKMTVFNYFPRKEDLFLDRPAEVVKDVTDAVRGRPAGTSVAEAVRELHRTWLAQRHPMSGVVAGVGFWRLVQETPALRTRLLEQREEFESAVAGVLRDEGVGSLEAQLVAGFVGVAHGTVFGTALGRMLGGDEADEVRRGQERVIEVAFDALDRAVAGLVVLPDVSPRQ
ncbi:TetR/AcrR family transcriptional regulator [Actinosynnema sp. NPDC051121]|nr:TetR/AcrR family transcriptional regulator [Saccharothrix sp.]